MIIKELRQTSAERFVITFHDGSELKTTLAVVTDFYLRTGLELDEAKYREVFNASTLSLCKARALRMINARAMSQKEMRDKLVEKGESPENAEFCAGWLCEMGLINDELYAGMVVRHYAAKGYGAGRIKQELRRHGVPKDYWDDALSEIPDSDEKLSRFISSRLTDPHDRAQIQKISNALYRRGYSWEQIKHAMNEFSSEEDM